MNSNAMVLADLDDFAYSSFDEIAYLGIPVSLLLLFLCLSVFFVQKSAKDKKSTINWLKRQFSLPVTVFMRGFIAAIFMLLVVTFISLYPLELLIIAALSSYLFPLFVALHLFNSYSLLIADNIFYVLLFSPLYFGWAFLVVAKSKKYIPVFIIIFLITAYIFHVGPTAMMMPDKIF